METIAITEIASRLRQRRIGRTGIAEFITQCEWIDAIPLDKVKQARKDIEQLKHKATDVEGYRWWNNAIDNCLHELDSLIAESEE